ncbi:MAG: Uma2 family endonuclease [Deltaproteobacteria bacterium]|nr:Uma2 family endonuclease [Deltaproteobacteria bacterium]
MTGGPQTPIDVTAFPEPEPWPQVPKLEDHHFLTEPMESERHLIALLLFYQLMKEVFRGRDDVFVGADLVVYFSELQVRNKDFRAPDGIAVLGVDGRERRGWILWEEDGRYPDLVIEHMSPSTRAVDLGIKVRIYGQVWKVREYFAFDLETGRIHAFAGTPDGLVPMEPNAAGRYPSKVLGGEIGVSDVPVEGRAGPWMRIFRPDGTLVPLPVERATAEAERATAEAERATSEATARAAAEARTAELEARLAELEARLARV